MISDYIMIRTSPLIYQSFQHVKTSTKNFVSEPVFYHLKSIVSDVGIAILAAFLLLDLHAISLPILSFSTYSCVSLV